MNFEVVMGKNQPRKPASTPTLNKATPKRRVDAKYANTSQFLVNDQLLFELMQENQLTISTLADRTGVSVAVIKKMQNGETVADSSAQAIANEFDLDLTDFGEHLAVALNSPELYHTLGLSNRIRPISTDMNFFQNFELGYVPNRPDYVSPLNNPIGFLWADSLGPSSIQAHVHRDSDTEVSYLRITFDNPDKLTRSSLYPSNVAVHPQWQAAVSVDLEEFPYLAIRCRINPMSPPLETSEPIQMALRVRDGKLRQWIYGTMETNYITSITEIPNQDGDWKVLYAPLRDRKWTAFGATPSTSFERRDFSVLTSVIVEVGIGGTGRRPSSGNGMIDIGAITFEKNTKGNT
jgi:transcriptional regulator with XRE-family HTH domain